MGLGLERIVYTSRARTSDVGLPMQVDILAASQRNNARDGLTGALLIHDGRFLQVLEGAGQDLDRLLKRLGDDPRHEGIEIIEREPIRQRRFGEWAMASTRVTPTLAALLRRTIEGMWTSDETLARLAEAVEPKAA
jgi:Sensors of blue-light using FAD